MKRIFIAVLCLTGLLLSACSVPTGAGSAVTTGASVATGSPIVIDGVDEEQTEDVLRYLGYFDIEEIISIEKSEEVEFVRHLEKSFEQEYTSYDVLDQKGEFFMLLNEYNDVVLIVDMNSGEIRFNMIIDEWGNPGLIEYEDLLVI